MLRRTLSCVLSVVLATTIPIGIAFAQAERDQSTSQINVKQTIKDIGEGYQPRITVTLKDGTVLEGYLSTVADDFFAVTNPKTAKTVKVSYDQVNRVKKQKPPRSSSGRPIAAIIGVIAIVVFAFTVYLIGDKKG